MMVSAWVTLTKFERGVRGDALQVRNKNLISKDIILSHIKKSDYIVITNDAKNFIVILFVKFDSNVTKFSKPCFQNFVGGKFYKSNQNYQLRPITLEPLGRGGIKSIYTTLRPLFGICYECSLKRRHLNRA